MGPCMGRRQSARITPVAIEHQGAYTHAHTTTALHTVPRISVQSMTPTSPASGSSDGIRPASASSDGSGPIVLPGSATSRTSIIGQGAAPLQASDGSRTGSASSWGSQPTSGRLTTRRLSTASHASHDSKVSDISEIIIAARQPPPPPTRLPANKAANPPVAPPPLVFIGIPNFKTAAKKIMVGSMVKKNFLEDYLSKKVEEIKGKAKGVPDRTTSVIDPQNLQILEDSTPELLESNELDKLKANFETYLQFAKTNDQAAQSSPKLHRSYIRLLEKAPHLLEKAPQMRASRLKMIKRNIKKMYHLLKVAAINERDSTGSNEGPLQTLWTEALHKILELTRIVDQKYLPPILTLQEIYYVRGIESIQLSHCKDFETAKRLLTLIGQLSDKDTQKQLLRDKFKESSAEDILYFLRTINELDSNYTLERLTLPRDLETPKQIKGISDILTLLLEDSSDDTSIVDLIVKKILESKYFLSEAKKELKYLFGLNQETHRRYSGQYENSVTSINKSTDLLLQIYIKLEQKDAVIMAELDMLQKKRACLKKIDKLNLDIKRHKKQRECKSFGSSQHRKTKTPTPFVRFSEEFGRISSISGHWTKVTGKILIKANQGRNPIISPSDLFFLCDPYDPTYDATTRLDQLERALDSFLSNSSEI